MSGKNKGGREIRKPKQVKAKVVETIAPLVRKSPPKKSG
jgi:hypothetical protein